MKEIVIKYIFSPIVALVLIRLGLTFLFHPHKVKDYLERKGIYKNKILKEGSEVWWYIPNFRFCGRAMIVMGVLILYATIYEVITKHLLI
jgi:hypothetical protein